MNIYKYTVIEIELPEWVTGSVNEIDSFNDPKSAFELRDSLKENDNDGYYEVIIENQLTQK